MKNIYNFHRYFIEFFPEEEKKIKENKFESILKLFEEKSQKLNEDKNFVFTIIKKNFKKIAGLRKKMINYYIFDRNKCTFNRSDELESKINSIEEFENKLDKKIITLNDNLEDNNNSDDSNTSNSDSESNESNNSRNRVYSNSYDENNEVSQNEKIHSIIKGKQFLIQNGVSKKKKSKNFVKKKLENIDFGKCEVNNIEISEINIIEIPKIISINSLIKFYDDCVLGAIILPLYVYKAKKSKATNDEENINKYFSILKNAYLSIKNEDNLISEYIKNFKKTFEYMISQLIEAGYNPDSSLSKISKPIKSKYNNAIFILPEKGNYKVPYYNFHKEVIPKSKNKNTNKKSNSKNKEIKKNKFHFSIPKPKIPLEKVKESQRIIRNNNSKKNRKPILQKTNIEGLYKEEAKSYKAITGNEFESKSFDVKDEIKIIVNNMRSLKKNLSFIKQIKI